MHFVPQSARRKGGTSQESERFPPAKGEYAWLWLRAGGVVHPCFTELKSRLSNFCFFGQAPGARSTILLQGTNGEEQRITEEVIEEVLAKP